MRTKALKEGQKVLLGDHSVLGRNKILPKFADDVWETMEVLDNVSEVYKV